MGQSSIYVCEDSGKSSVWDFPENRLWSVVDKPYHSANSRLSPRQIALRWGTTLFCLRSHNTPNNREIMVWRCCYARVWRFRIRRVYPGSQLNGPGWSRSKWTQRSRAGLYGSIELWTLTLLVQKASYTYAYCSQVTGFVDNMFLWASRCSVSL